MSHVDQLLREVGTSDRRCTPLATSQSLSAGLGFGLVVPRSALSLRQSPK